MKPEQNITPDFDPETWADVDWMADLLPFPAEVSPPLLQSPPPADAVWTYGIAAEEWIEREMKIRLRHWQRWALRLQWAHRADGSLCYRTVVESTPRRSGKSVRLRSAAVYRTAHPEVFGEQQLVLLAGKDSAIVLEHHRKSWKWAKEQGWELRRRTGAEEIEAPDGSRFVIRGKDSCWGYDIGYGIVDEAHGVHPSVVDDAIEPSLLDRTCPQLHVVSTSSRNATALMRRKINAAQANGYEDRSTLLMVWAAPPGSDISDPAVWRSANPHWTSEREEFMGTKYEQAQAGQADPTDDDPDPIASFTSQYLNQGWWATGEAKDAGEPVVTEDEWAGLNGWSPGTPVVAAVESWFQAGAAMVTAEQLPGGRIGVSSMTFGDVPTAVAAARASGAQKVLVGKSIAVGLQDVTPVGGTTRQAMLGLRRFIDDGVLAHDGAEALTEQALALRTVASSDGPRLVSKGRADAVKACAWAVTDAQQTVEPAGIF